MNPITVKLLVLLVVLLTALAYVLIRMKIEDEANRVIRENQLRTDRMFKAILRLNMHLSNEELQDVFDKYHNEG